MDAGAYGARCFNRRLMMSLSAQTGRASKLCEKWAGSDYELAD